jgi:hypothetical protein
LSSSKLFPPSSCCSSKIDCQFILVLIRQPPNPCAQKSLLQKIDFVV